MARALQVLLIFCASLLVGLWGRGLLMDLGLLRDFDTTLTIAAFLAAAYGVSQCAFHGLVMFMKPTRGAGAVISEALAQLSALFLIPSLLGLALPLPAQADSLPAIVMPLLYFAAFVSFHLFFKLMFFFAAVQGPPAPRSYSFFWLVPSGAALFALVFSAVSYLISVDKVTIVQGAEMEPVAVGEIVLPALLLSENQALPFSLSCESGKTVSLFFAACEEVETEDAPLYVRVRSYTHRAEGEEALFRASPSNTTRYQLHLREGIWVPLTFDCALFPAKTQSILVDWSSQDPGDWPHRLGLKKHSASNRRIWVGEVLVQ
ncbi:MAG: hypothetical protein GX130_10720 [Candidatus Hydrogenedens sp.]|nr:hypothetical protein [Candidatus Hydrogenedens sp.]